MFNKCGMTWRMIDVINNIYTYIYMYINNKLLQIKRKHKAMNE